MFQNIFSNLQHLFNFCIAALAIGLALCGTIIGLNSETFSNSFKDENFSLVDFIQIPLECSSNDYCQKVNLEKNISDLDKIQYHIISDFSASMPNVKLQPNIEHNVIQDLNSYYSAKTERFIDKSAIELLTMYSCKAIQDCGIESENIHLKYYLDDTLQYLKPYSVGSKDLNSNCCKSMVYADNPSVELDSPKSNFVKMFSSLLLSLPSNKKNVVLLISDFRSTSQSDLLEIEQLLEKDNQKVWQLNLLKFHDTENYKYQTFDSVLRDKYRNAFTYDINSKNFINEDNLFDRAKFKYFISPVRNVNRKEWLIVFKKPANSLYVDDALFEKNLELHEISHIEADTNVSIKAIDKKIENESRLGRHKISLSSTEKFSIPSLSLYSKSLGIKKRLMLDLRPGLSSESSKLLLLGLAIFFSSFFVFLFGLASFIKKRIITAKPNWRTWWVVLIVYCGVPAIFVLAIYLLSLFSSYTFLILAFLLCLIAGWLFLKDDV